jgi:hypothetical protein
LTGRGAEGLLRIPRYAAITALVIGAGTAAAGCTTPATPSSSAPPARSALAQTATAWWNSAGQGFFEASNQDLTAVNNDGVNNPPAVPADDQQLISDAQAALANPPPADPADYNAYYNDVLQLADNPGPMTGEDAAINNDGAQHLQSFQDALACYVPSAGGTCPTWGSSGGSAPAPGASSAAPAPDSASAPDTSAPVAAPSQSSADPAAEQHAQTDLSTVQGISFSSDLAALHRDVQVTANDTAALKTAVAAGPGVSGECFSASAINAAASKIFNSFGPSDQVSLGSDATTLQQDISTARSAISALQEDVSTLQSTGSPVPSGTQAAITSAQNAISQAVTTGNADIDQANALANHAVTDISSLDTPTDLCANAVDRYEQGSGIAHVS